MQAEELLQVLKSHTPISYMESLTKEPIIQAEIDVIQSFQNFRLTDEVVNTILYYMLFMNRTAPWDQLMSIAQFCYEHHITTAEEALDTVQKLQQYEAKLDS